MSPVARLLRVVTVVRAPEAPKALLLTLNSFLLIFGYYQVKAAREGLLLAAHGAPFKAYLAIPQLLLLVLGVKAFAWLASRVPRHLLITYRGGVHQGTRYRNTLLLSTREVRRL